VFDPFPFPDCSETLRQGIGALAEELDAFRKARQGEHPRLTITHMYNVLEKLRAGVPLDGNDERVKSDGLVLILKEVHDKLDALALDAYGWPADLPDEQVIARLVALNKERAAEERRGLIRWLRPDYQKARAGIAEERPPEPEKQLEAELVALPERGRKPLFPAPAVEQVAAVMAALQGAGAALDAAAVCTGFRQGRKAERKVRQTLVALYRLGLVDSPDQGRTFTLRRAA